MKNLEMGLLKTTGAWKAFGGLFVGDEEGGREVERREGDAVVSLVVSKRQRGRGRGQSQTRPDCLMAIQAQTAAPLDFCADTKIHPFPVPSAAKKHTRLTQCVPLPSLHFAVHCQRQIGVDE